jgi:hypothetical protein
MQQRTIRQYSIRTLLISVAVVGVLFAIGNLIGAEWMSLTLWVGLLVIAHVAGAIIGHRRRSIDAAALDPPDASQLARGAPIPEQSEVRVTELARTQPLARWVRHCTIGGACLGALGGVGGMWVLGAASVNGLVLGTISAAVLGAFFAFMASSFLAIAANAFDEARKDGK